MIAEGNIGSHSPTYVAYAELQKGIKNNQNNSFNNILFESEPLRWNRKQHDADDVENKHDTVEC